MSRPDRSGNRHTNTHPEQDDVSEADLNYVNRYFFSTSEDLGGIFDEIMSEVSNEAFYATAESTGGQQSAVIYEAKSANTWRSRTLSEYCGV